MAFLGFLCGLAAGYFGFDGDTTEWIGTLGVIIGSIIMLWEWKIAEQNDVYKKEIKKILDKIATTDYYGERKALTNKVKEWIDEQF